MQLYEYLVYFSFVVCGDMRQLHVQMPHLCSSREENVRNFSKTNTKKLQYIVLDKCGIYMFS